MLSSLARQAFRKVGASPLKSSAFQGSRAFATGGFPPPRLFDYETVTSNLTVNDAIESVEEAFKALAKGKVDVPMPMHIGIEESDVAGPGDCHIKARIVCKKLLKKYHYFSLKNNIADLVTFITQ